MTTDLPDESASSSAQTPAISTSPNAAGSREAPRKGSAPDAPGRPEKGGLTADVTKAGLNGVAESAGRAVEGTGDSRTRRYAGRAVAGAVGGAARGDPTAAAIGAAKEAGLALAHDAAGNTGSDPATSRLGAGGTGLQRGSAGGENDTRPPMAKGVAIGGSIASTPPAMAAAMLMALLNWLKSMFFAFTAMTVNLAALLYGFLVTVVKALAHAVIAPFIAVGGFLANAVGTVLGVSVAAAVAPVAAAISGLATLVGAIAMVGTILSGALTSPALTDGGQPSAAGAGCAVKTTGGGDGAVVPANTEANAKTVYSVLSTWGMPKENIAGILGNWSQESGIDPTSVESIFTEPYRIGPRKQAAWDGGFTHIPGQAHGGIGLGQWSNGRTTLLLDYARARNKDWYAIQTQLAFMVEGDNPGDVQVFKDMVTNPQGSPGTAAYHFHNAWERSADSASMMAERAEDAERWFASMSGWTVDESVAGDIKTIIGDLVDTVGDGARALSRNCSHDGDRGGGSATPPEGGMTEQEARALIDLFNQEGDKFLDTRYGENGGPGSCGSNHAMNCVSFSTYFVNKYTTLQTYPSGDGIQTAHTIAERMGKATSPTPAPYSVGSGPGSGPSGHTLVVLGVQGDRLVIGEAGYCAFMGRIRIGSATEMAAQGWIFVDMSDAMLPPDQIKTA
ncbi:phage tail tip lysozyme [Amycolatopsis azurea]|uniref:phage tail tip lysozyme n=1 Tax=Amycolatopsis azurea TaxID=36819 RepID=UPI003823949E